MQEVLFKKAFLYPTSNCNLACQLCYAKKTLNQSFNDKNHLEKYKMLIDRLIDSGVSEFDISGGEPFLYSFIFEFLAYIFQKKGTQVTLVTNGTLLSKKVDKSNVSILKQVRELHVSFDDNEAVVHDLYRGCQGAFNNAMRGLKYMQELGLRNICINTIIFSGNYGKVYHILNFAYQLGVQKICLLRLLDLQTSSGQNQSLSLEQISELLSNVLAWIDNHQNDMHESFQIELTLPGVAYSLATKDYKLRLKNIYHNIDLILIFDPFRGCNAFRKNIIISTNGEATGCTCMLGDPKWVAGNVFESSLTTIRERFDIIYQNIKNNISTHCLSCTYALGCKGGCPIVPCSIQNTNAVKEK